MLDSLYVMLCVGASWTRGAPRCQQNARGAQVQRRRRLTQANLTTRPPNKLAATDFKLATGSNVFATTVPVLGQPAFRAPENLRATPSVDPKTVSVDLPVDPQPLLSVDRCLGLLQTGVGIIRPSPPQRTHANIYQVTQPP